MASNTRITGIQSEANETSLCTSSTCVQDENDQYKVECAECKRLVHYRCTELPPYQVQLFLTKGYRKFICVNCVVLQKYLLDIIPRVVIPQQRHTKTMSELTVALNQSAEENETQIVKNLALANKHNQLCAELEKQADVTKKDREALAQLKSVIAKYENSIKIFEENERKLRATIANQQKQMDDQQDKFEQAGNPDYDSIVKLEEVMKKQIDQVGDSIKESLLREIHDNKKQIEEKLTQVMNQHKTYAESVINNQATENTQPKQNSQTKPPETLDLRTIIREERNDELAEENEKKRRACNIILHGVNEAFSVDKNEAKKHDET